MIILDRVGLYIWASHANNIKFKNIKERTSDIFLFSDGATIDLRSFIKKAQNEGIRVHLWTKCFHKDGQWVNPGSETFESQLLTKIKKYTDMEPDGIHLDYIRYPGTAYKYDGTKKITNFAKRAREIIPDNIMLSFAVMPEGAATLCYYGQDYKELGKLGVLVPMAYKGNYKQGSIWINSATNTIRAMSGNARVWTAIQSYYSDENPKPLPLDELQKDIEQAKSGGAEKVVLFRYGLITPDFFKTTQASTWVLTGYFQPDLQDTGYTCGPSSLQMALSALGCNVTESQLAKWAGTTRAGTTPAGMIQAVKRASGHCKVPLSVTNPSFKSTGWQKIIEHIKRGCEIIIHLITYPYLKNDYQGNPVWKAKYGHYVYLVGVDPKNGLVKIADPTKGIRTFKMSDVEKAIAAVTWANSLYIICRI